MRRQQSLYGEMREDLKKRAEEAAKVRARMEEVKDKISVVYFIPNLSYN